MLGVSIATVILKKPHMKYISKTLVLSRNKQSNFLSGTYLSNNLGWQQLEVA